MGEEYPLTGCVGELTAPKRAPWQSERSASTVTSGRAAPVRSKASKPAWRSRNSNLSLREDGRASRMRRPAGMTSLPMPSPGMRPARAKVSHWGYSSCLGAGAYQSSAYGSTCWAQLGLFAFGCWTLDVLVFCWAKLLAEDRRRFGKISEAEPAWVEARQGTRATPYNRAPQFSSHS